MINEMEKKDYETVIVYDAALDEGAVNKELSKVEDIIKAHGGVIQKKTIAGRKKLAYPIRHREFGVYVLLVHDGGAKIGADLERQFQINESVLRHLVVKRDKYAPEGELVLDEGTIELEEVADIIEDIVDDEEAVVAI